MGLLHVTECEVKPGERKETNSMEQSSQLVKKFLLSYGSRRFINALTRARHMSLFWARSVRSMPHPTSWRSILILPSYLCLGLPSDLFPSCLLTTTLYASLLSLSRTCYMPRPSLSSWCDHPNNIGWGVQIIKLLILWSSPLPRQTHARNRCTEIWRQSITSEGRWNWNRF